MGLKPRFRWLALAGALVLTAGCVRTARAQDPDDLKRGVARISLMNGDVSVRRGDSGDWVAGVINAPLMTDDWIASGPNSRGEIQFDASNMLRFGASTEFHLTQLEYGRYQMEIAHGILTYRVLRSADANINVEIDTPNVSVRPSRLGSYRISVNEAGETEVTARTGDVEVFTPTGSQWVHAGQTMVARGTQADPEFQILTANPPDDWDHWSDGRDRTLLQSQSARNVGPGVYGAEDLDSYGNWVSVPDYGNVWQPAVGPDWAPYQAGRWVWGDWYGWTWVSYDPWGWAPYHYGRWFHHDRFGWCWYPGVIGVRHYWSPALVAFFGFGPGGGVGFGFGNVGWVPLAPYEVYRPWWGHGYYGRPGFNHYANVTNVNITNVYRNSRVTNGIHGVGFTEFQNGRFNNIQHFNGNQIREAGLVRGQLPVAPNHASLNFTDRQATAIPRSNQPGRFFTHQQPNPVARQPYGGGSVGSRSPVSPSQGIAPNRGANGDAPGSWRRFGNPAPQANPQGNEFRSNASPNSQVPRNDRPPQAQRGSAFSNPPSNGGGWQRFGEPARNSAPNPMPRNGSGGGGQPVRERSSGGPAYNAPRPSSPAFSAPRGNPGGGGGNHGGGGGGGNHGSGSARSSSGGNHGGRR